MKRPTLQTLIATKENEYAALLGIAQLPQNSVEKVLAGVQAGSEHALYAYADYQSKQINPATCNEAWLKVWAESYSVVRQQAIAAVGKVKFTGATGKTIVAQTVLIAGTQRFSTIQTATITNNRAIISVIAQTPGKNGNLTIGTELKLETAVGGLDSQVTVSEALTGGADIESIENWRARVVQAFNQTPDVGDVAHYVRIAKSVSSLVSHVWVSDAEAGMGSVTLRIICDSLTYRLPDATTLTAVNSKVQQNKVAGSVVNIIAPVPKPIDFNISLITNTKAARDAITTNLRNYVYSLLTQSAMIKESDIDKAIALTTTNYTLISPVGNTKLQAYEVANMGVVTWQ